MAGPVTLQFSSPPAIAPSYLKILLARKSSFVAGSVPRMEAVLDCFKVDRAHLARYRTICGDRGEHELPVSYPHVLAAPIHLAMMASESFPVSLLGVVHTRNRIVQRRPLRVDETGQLRTWLEGHRETARGQELDLQTEVRIDSQVIWSETSTLLARKAGRGRAGRARDAPLPALEMPPRQAVTSVAIAPSAAIGRQYARVSGDFNPIHIADLSARLFGFKRAIVHGMWSLARCAAEIGDACFSRPCMLDVAFKRPIACCAPMVLESWMADQRVGFTLHPLQEDRGHLLGSVSPA